MACPAPVLKTGAGLFFSLKLGKIKVYARLSFCTFATMGRGRVTNLLLSPILFVNLREAKE